MILRFDILLSVLIVIHLYHPTSAHSHKRSISADELSKAFEHGARVRQEGACHTPHPTVVYVNSTSPSKVYLPRGTVLHRCSDLTGCCQHPSEQCQPIEMQTVELYFITITLQVQQSSALHQHQLSSQYRGGRRVRQSPQVEKMLFTNHTQCGCRERNSVNINELDSVDDVESNELK